MLKLVLSLIVFLSATVIGQFPYSPNPYAQFSNAINYHYYHVDTDNYGNKWLRTYVMPTMAGTADSQAVTVMGEGFFHVWEFLDLNVTTDYLPYPQMTFGGGIDQHIFTFDTIQLTPRIFSHYEIMSPAWWTMYYPVAWVGPIPQLSEAPASCSFHFDPFQLVGGVMIKTSESLIPPQLYGLYFHAQHHTIINFYSDFYGSGWGSKTTTHIFTLS